MCLFGNTIPDSRGFVAIPVTKSKNLVSLHQYQRDKVKQIFCMVSTIHFLLGHLNHKGDIKFRDLLRNNNKLIWLFGSKDSFSKNYEITCYFYYVM